MTNLRRWVGTDSFWLALLLGGSLIVRLTTLGIRPFDGDEGVILDVVTQPTLSDAWTLIARDVHPPLLHLLTWLATQALGVSEWSARLVPALASVGIIWLAFGYWRRISGPRTAWLTASLIAVSPQSLFFAQELRFYSLLTLLTLGSIYLLTRLHESFSWSRLIGWVLVNWALTETQHLGLIILAAEGLVIGWWTVQGVISIRLRRREIPSTAQPTAGSLSRSIGGLEMTSRLLLALLITGLLYLPTLPTTLHQFVGRLGGEDQTGLALRTNAVGTINGLYRLGVGNLAAGIDASPAGFSELLHTDPIKLGTFALSFLLLIGFLVAGWRALTTEQRRRLTPLLFVAGSLLLAALLSRQVGERASRNLYLLSPLSFGLLASGIVAAWGRRANGKRQTANGRSAITLSRVGAGLLVGFILAGTVIQFQLIQRPGVDAIAAFIDPRLQRGDVVLTKGTYLHGESFVFNYYSKTHPPVVDYYGEYDVNLGNLDELNEVPVQARLDALLGDHPRVWFYDLIGDPVSWHGTPHQLGIDKEGLPLVVWEIQR